MKRKKTDTGLVVYQAKSGAIELRGDTTHETLWATQAEIARLFGVTPQSITMHLAAIFKEKELDRKATCKDFLQVQMEGKRQVKRTVKLYNLDVIIAVGYRINSVIGTQFRIWATKTLREHITKGYTLNRKQIARNYDSLRSCCVSELWKVTPGFINNFLLRGIMKVLEDEGFVPASLNQK
ncbi:MAG: virulence RhuM family protein [Patescibacteria group bacterium]|nr:virulence RhuM family protein [Patescibacteria group bacterium]